MFTQCPKCQSVFMVSEKDIKAHEGLVRCGNCYSVFNSSWNLTDDPRNDFIEEVTSANKPVVTDGQDSVFTFSIMDKAAAASSVTGNDAAQAEESDSEKPATSAAQEDPLTSIQNDLPPDADLEPFPEPEIEDFEHPSLTPAMNSDNSSLLYFDANAEDTDEERVETMKSGHAPIEDLTLLQTPSLRNEIPELVQGDRAESEKNTFSDDSMWPDEDADREGESVLQAPAADSVKDIAEGVESLAEKSPVALPDNVVINDTPVDTEPAVEALPEIPHAVEILDDSGSLLSPTIEDVQEMDDSFIDDPHRDSTSQGGQEDHSVDEIVTEAANIESMAVLEVDAGLPSSGQNERKGKSTVADDTFYVDGDQSDADDFFSIESLPNTADEVFSKDKKGNDIEGSVFITSEKEEVDESYIPISLKTGRKDQLFHDLDDFPEPGELSALNYEDTMEINAMLEEANISKEEIESALSASEIANEDDEDGFNGESLLSSDAGNDLTDALFPSSAEEGGRATEDISQRRRQSASFVSYFRNLMPAVLGSKKHLRELKGGDDQTQLIRSLNRSNTRSVLPVWVGKYTLPAAISVLVVLLFVQIGYFYMDKLVHITPLRPLLEAGCKIAGCTVPRIQDINDIKQLSSRLTPISGDGGGLKVSSILVNRGIRSQPFPAFELILTDRAGNMISRRIVTSGSYLESDTQNVMEPNEAVDINIRFRTPSIRVDGFELRAVSQNWLERKK